MVRLKPLPQESIYMSIRLTQLLAILVLSIPGLVNANTILYGNKIGVTMQFLGIQETSMSAGDTAPLFGAPILSGDSLIFNNMTFSSSASGGASDITDGKLDTTIQSKNNPSYYIDKIRFQEFGDTTLAGTGTAATRSSAACSLFLQVVQLDSGPIWEPISLNMTMSEGGQWTLPPQITGHLWNGVVDVNLTTILQGLGYSGHATEVLLTMDNTLTTSSEVGTSAFIAKKAEGLRVTPMLVPEPGVVSLLLLGGLFLRKRR
jgi:hypothetical protein